MNFQGNQAEESIKVSVFADFTDWNWLEKCGFHGISLEKAREANHAVCLTETRFHPRQQTCCSTPPVFTEVSMLTPENTAFFCVLLFTLVTAITDVRERRIPNKLTFPFFFCGILFQIWYVITTGGSVWSPVLGLAVSTCILGTMWILGGTGAGDVKLMMGLGVWLGLDKVLLVMLLSLVTSLFLMGCIKVMRKLGLKTRIDMTKLKKGEEPKRVIIRDGVRYKRGIPYALGVCLAAWCVVGLNLVRQLQ